MWLSLRAGASSADQSDQSPVMSFTPLDPTQEAALKAVQELASMAAQESGKAQQLGPVGPTDFAKQVEAWLSGV